MLFHDLNLIFSCINFQVQITNPGCVADHDYHTSASAGLPLTVTNFKNEKDSRERPERNIASVTTSLLNGHHHNLYAGRDWLWSFSWPCKRNGSSLGFPPRLYAFRDGEAILAT